MPVKEPIHLSAAQRSLLIEMLAMLRLHNPKLRQYFWLDSERGEIVYEPPHDPAAYIVYRAHPGGAVIDCADGAAYPTRRRSDAGVDELRRRGLRRPDEPFNL